MEKHYILDWYFISLAFINTKYLDTLWDNTAYIFYSISFPWLCWCLWRMIMSLCCRSVTTWTNFKPKWTHHLLHSKSNQQHLSNQRTRIKLFLKIAPLIPWLNLPKTKALSNQAKKFKTRVNRVKQTIHHQIRVDLLRIVLKIQLTAAVGQAKISQIKVAGIKRILIQMASLI